MWRRLLTTVLVLGVAGISPAAFAEETPAARFELAKSAFEYQDYDKTVKLIRPLLEPEPTLPSRDMVLKAREMLGASLWWKKDKSGFKQQLTELLIEEPSFELDSFYYPPEMVKDFNDLKQHLVKMNVIKITKTEQPTQVVIHKTVEMQNYMVNFVPFGGGQFAAGRTGPGLAFMSGQLLTLGANVSAWSYMYYSGVVGDERRVPLYVMYVSLAMFGAVYVGGVVDSLMAFEPVRIIEEKQVENGDGSASMFRVMPAPLGGDTFGLVMGTTF